ncbi:MAG: polysaccharide deacetylase family protein [Planctomycetota bacterium]
MDRPRPRKCALMAAFRPRVKHVMWATGTLVCLIGVMIPACGPLQVAVLPSFERRGADALFRVDVGDEKLVALTIDDGPSRHTDAILDVLAERDATATFFVHSDHVRALGDDGPRLLRRILDEGHELGNHTAADVPSVTLSEAEFAESFGDADALLREHGVEPRWFRAAGGTYTDAMLPVVREAGYEPAFVLGSFLPWDTFLYLPTTYGAQLGRDVFPGAIVVLHEGQGRHAGRGPRTLKTLRWFLDRMEQRGYEVRTLSEVVEAELVEGDAG